MKPLYIFDLDGTLALCEHRQHLVQSSPPDWPAFYQACDRDKPNVPVVRTLRMLADHADIMIFSGRSDEVRAKTEVWLAEHVLVPMLGVMFPMLQMRPAGLYTPDEELKQHWYECLPPHDKARLVAVFDDRAKVVAMWRSIGVACFQVAAGEF